MANKKYPSKYSNGKEVGAAQYITELICEKRAKLNKLDLHYRFWLNKEWSAFYRNQIGSAHKLLKKYSDVAIVRALNNPKTERIYSLRAPHLLPIIELEQAKFDSENTAITIDLKRPKSIRFGSNKKDNKKNIFSKLKDIDNEC
jgi:hypothetical protein